MDLIAYLWSCNSWTTSIIFNYSIIKLPGDNQDVKIFLNQQTDMSSSCIPSLSRFIWEFAIHLLTVWFEVTLYLIRYFTIFIPHLKTLCLSWAIICVGKREGIYF